MSNSKYDIFISYRRVGGSDKARILKAELEKRGYQDRVFLDYDELKDGKFDKRIMDAIEDAPVFIFILTPGSLDRCVNDDDWVRQEILYAVKTERHIIPVNFDKLFTEFPENIPSNVKNAIGQHQFSQVDSETLLKASVDQLVRDRIEPLLKTVQSSSKGQEEGAKYHVYTDCDCTMERFGKKIGNAYVDGDCYMRLKLGRHKLKFVSLQNPVDYVEMVIEVDSNDKEDFIDVELAAVVKAREEAERKAREEAERKAREEWLLAQPDDSFGQIYQNGEWDYVDKNGNAITPVKYDVLYEFREGLAKVKLNRKWGFIDKTGKEVIPFMYDSADWFSEGLARVKLNEKWGFIDKVGKEVIPLKYDDAQSFYIGHAPVELNGKWGFIENTGKEVTPLMYEIVDYFRNGRAAVTLNGESFHIDKTGKRVK